MSRAHPGRRRRLLVPLISATTLAIGFSAPIASAEPIKPTDNTGSVADGETRADPQQCKMYKDWYDADVKAGDKSGATYTKNLADRRGCRWAERLAVKQSLREASAAPEPSGVSPGETSTGLESPLIVYLAPPS